MDITTVFGLNYNEGRSNSPADTINQWSEGLVNNKGKTDALSAVKLDPAVLEAQVTIDTVPNTPNYGSEGSFNEQTVEKEPSQMNFEETLINLQENSLLNLSSQQCALLLIYVNNLRRQRIQFQNHGECAFCKSSGQSAMCYTSHSLRDGSGRIRCPMLRALRCPRCGESGDRAHTPKYCPIKRR
ncbi:unnamed protein product, partial [Iphiclides podalirius]